MGPSVTQQQSTASFGVSDYPGPGIGYSMVGQQAWFGLGRIRSMIPCGYSGNAEGYTWIYDTALNAIRVYNGTAELSASSNFSPGTVKWQANGLG
jgi:hypothetical protein